MGPRQSRPQRQRADPGLLIIASALAGAGSHDVVARLKGKGLSDRQIVAYLMVDFETNNANTVIRRVYAGYQRAGLRLDRVREILVLPDIPYLIGAVAGNSAETAAFVWQFARAAVPAWTYPPPASVVHGDWLSLYGNWARTVPVEGSSVGNWITSGAQSITVRFRAPAGGAVLIVEVGDTSALYDYGEVWHGPAAHLDLPPGRHVVFVHAPTAGNLTIGPP
jgi:hypothetical protein